MAACSDGGPRRPASIELSEFPDTLLVGESRVLTATCLDADGAPIPNSPVSWLSLEPQLVSLRPSGATTVVYGLHPSSQRVGVMASCQRGPLTRSPTNAPQIVPPTMNGRGFIVVASSASQWAVDDVGDTLVLRAPTAEDSLTSTTRVVSARGVTSLGYVVPPTSFTFESSDPDVATVDASGQVRARAVGEATLTVALGADEREVPISVRAEPEMPNWDVALIDAHWTQGPQDLAQSVPILRESRAAVVNVLAAATSDTLPYFVKLEVIDATSTVFYTDTVPLRLTAGAQPTFASPNAQFLVPRNVVNAAASWRMFLLGPAADFDAVLANNRLPRTGEMVLNAITPPVLKLHLVPVVLAEHGNVQTALTAAQTVYYDSIARLRLPLGRVEVTIGAPVVSDAEFFDSTGAGGIWSFWTDVISDVDAARVKSAFPERHWIGVVPKPAGALGSRYGGVGYIPALASSFGPMTRTQASLSHEWYTSPFSAGQTVAHELGHNFSRPHAPCGTAGSPDPHYPVAAGGVGQWVTWTTALESGASPNAQILLPSVGDVMGYCGSNFLGPYTYLGILRYRALSGSALVAPRARTQILAVRGLLRADTAVVTRTEFTEGELIAEPASSPVEVRVLAADGTELARVHALVGMIGDEDAGRPFTAHIPMDAATRARVDRVVAHIIRR
jgi:hypothetical protein